MANLNVPSCDAAASVNGAPYLVLHLFPFDPPPVPFAPHATLAPE